MKYGLPLAGMVMDENGKAIEGATVKTRGQICCPTGACPRLDLGRRPDLFLQMLRRAKPRSAVQAKGIRFRKQDHRSRPGTAGRRVSPEDEAGGSDTPISLGRILIQIVDRLRSASVEAK